MKKNKNSFYDKDADENICIDCGQSVEDCECNDEEDDEGELRGAS